MEKAAEKPVEYSGCPWACMNMRDREMRCEAFITFRVFEGKCIGDKCAQYTAWAEAMKAIGWRTEKEQKNATVQANDTRPQG